MTAPTPTDPGTPGPAESHTDAPEPQSGAEVPDDAPLTVSEARKLRSEARSLRERLKASEEQYEAAATVVGAMQHAEIERLASEHLIDPSDVWRAGSTEFFDTEFTGMVSADKVSEQVKKLIAERPHLAKPEPPSPPPTNRPIEGLRPGARQVEPVDTPSWASVLRG